MKRIFAEIAAKFVAVFKKFLGMGIWQVINWIYDNPIWIAVELAFGFQGVIFLIIGALGINFSVLYYYRQKKIAWLCWDEGVDFLKNSRGFMAKRIIFGGVFLGIIFCDGLIFLLILAIEGFFQLLAYGLRISWLEKAIMFFLLSLYQDSFIATAYFKNNIRKNGLEARDYAIFSASSIVSIAYWVVRNGIIAETLRFLLK